MKNLFGKVVTMVLAAIMAVSAMSIGAMAEENENIDFYNTVQILTFNAETGEFDSTYEPVSDTEQIMPLNENFRFDQYISTSGNFLRNLNNNNDESYAIGSDDTMVIKVNKAPAHTLYVNLYKNNGTMYYKGGAITTEYTEYRFNGLNDYFSPFGSLKIKLTATSQGENVSGRVSKY